MSTKLESVADSVSIFVESLARESERAAVVLGGSKLDSLLERLLKKFLYPSHGANDELLDADRPLGTFSARIALAYRLRVIDKDIEYSLHAVRKIRNSFAHSIEDERLTKPAHRDKLSAIEKILSSYTGYAGLVLHAKQRNATMSDELAKFCAAMMILIIVLETACKYIERVKPSKTFRLRIPS